MYFSGAMCVNTNCTHKTNCQRSEASGTTPNKYQVYAFLQPDKNNNCEYQVKLYDKPKDKIEQLSL